MADDGEALGLSCLLLVIAQQSFHFLVAQRVASGGGLAVYRQHLTLGCDGRCAYGTGTADRARALLILSPEAIEMGLRAQHPLILHD